jgi:hypothetical protein
MNIGTKVRVISTKKQLDSAGIKRVGPRESGVIKARIEYGPDYLYHVRMETGVMAWFNKSQVKPI